MGCASSSPLVESGKNFVETAKNEAGEVVSKGEKTLQDVGEKISTEVDTMKDAMKSVLDTAESSINTAMGKVSNNVNSTTDEIKETVNKAEADAEDALNVMSDSATEAVSEAETVLASEAENAKEMVSSTVSEVFTKVDSTKEAVEEKAHELEENVKNSLLIEDMEQNLDGLGDNVNKIENKVEEIVSKMQTPPASPVKEESPPTCWEAAADAILRQKSISTYVDIFEIDGKKESHLTDSVLETNLSDVNNIEEETNDKHNTDFLLNSKTDYSEKSC